jgi:peptide/nickel transport system substrate-binding protein
LSIVTVSVARSAMERNRIYKLVLLAEGGAGVVALSQFTPYSWFQPFDEALKPIQAKYGLDSTAHPDKVAQLMGSKGYVKDGEGFWAKGGERLNLKIYVPDWLKGYGPPITQQLQDAGLNATFDTSPGLGTQVQSGEQALYFGCQGPSGVKGMDPYYMLSLFTSQYFRPTGTPASNVDATSRWQNEKYEAIVQQMDTLKVDDPKTMELFKQAMDVWFSEMPMVYVSELLIRYPMTTEYWTGWPSKDQPFGFPHSWQQEFMKTIVSLQPTK